MDKAAPTSIAILVHSMNEGGAQQRLVSLANRFAARGHAVDFVAVSGAGGAGRGLDAGVEHRALMPEASRPLLRFVAGLGPLRAYLAQRCPDVLMAGSNRVHVVAASACAGLEKSPLLVLRAARHPVRRPPWSQPRKRLRELWLRPLERAALARADLVVAVSAECAADLAARTRAPVVTIPNPTITEKFKASLESRVEHRWFDAAEGGGDPVILGVGRIETSKDFETLVEAVAIATATRPLRLILLGEGSRRGAVDALVARRGIADRVELAGHVDAVGGWLARADLLVSSSLWEGSPGVIIEAFAAGLPVVATACPGGSVELLENEVGGMLVPPRDPAAMAKAMLAMLARPRDRDAVRALAAPFQDDGRADLAYLSAFAAAAKLKKAAAPA